AARGGDRRRGLEQATRTRLVAGERLVKPETCSFRALAGRLLERLSALHAHYAGAPPPYDAPALLRAAAEIRVVERALVWRELSRGSGRQGRPVPMGGLTGWAVIEGDLAPFLPGLVWGSLTQVGKDAAMGNG